MVNCDSSPHLRPLELQKAANFRFLTRLCWISNWKGHFFENSVQDTIQQHFSRSFEQNSPQAKQKKSKTRRCRTCSGSWWHKVQHFGAKPVRCLQTFLPLENLQFFLLPFAILVLPCAILFCLSLYFFAFRYTFLPFATPFLPFAIFLLPLAIIFCLLQPCRI